MDERIEQLIAGCTKNEAASQDAIDGLLEAVPYGVPRAYIDLMRAHNGVEGFIGENAYLIMWRIEELVEMNVGYNFTAHLPYLVLFGTNGGDAGYAFDSRSPNMPVLEVPFID